MLRKDEEPKTNEMEAALAKDLATPDILIDDVDFNDLLELEKASKNVEEQLNKLSGTIYRLKQDQDIFHNHEKTILMQLETKRKELVKRYKIDEKKKWGIDINSKKVIYQ